MFTWFKKRFTKGVKKPKEEGQKREYHDDGAKPLDEAAFNSLHIGYEMRSQFMYGIPLSRERYVGQVHGHYNSPPTYEEYRRLFEKYQNIIRERENWSEYYFRHLG